MSNEGFETVNLSVSEDMKTLVAGVDGYKIYILLSTLNFPNYQGVVPDYKPSPLNVSCQDLQAVIRRILLTSDKNRTLKMTLKTGELTISSRNVGNFEGHETVDMENYQGPFGSLSVNGKFLNDIITSTVSDSINIRFHNDDTPVLIIPVCEPKECHSEHVLVPIKEGGA
jgi:DNA polymerase III sliding clamp (beta) subunit (PCNA family)